MNKIDKNSEDRNIIITSITYYYKDGTIEKQGRNRIIPYSQLDYFRKMIEKHFLNGLRLEVRVELEYKEIE